MWQQFLASYEELMRSPQPEFVAPNSSQDRKRKRVNEYSFIMEDYKPAAGNDKMEQDDEGQLCFEENGAAGKQRTNKKKTGKRTTTKRTRNETALEIIDYENSSFFMPDEMLLHIFSYLPSKVLCLNVTLVSKRWARIVESPYLWKQVALDLSFSRSNTSSSLDNSVKLMRVLKNPRYRSIQRLVIGPIAFGKATMTKIMSCCPDLVSFIVGGQPVLPATTIHNTNYHTQLKKRRKKTIQSDQLVQLNSGSSGKLRELTLPYYDSDWSSVAEAFSVYSDLTTLTIESVSGAFPDLVKAIANHCKALRFLRLGLKSSSFSNTELILLAKNLPHLQVLQLHPCRAVNENGIKELSVHAPHLASLQLYQCRSVSDEALTSLAEHCPSLKILEITTDFLSCTTVTHQGYLALVSKGIEAVNIPLCKSNSRYGASIPEFNRWSAVSVIFSMLNKCMGDSSPIEVNMTNRELRLKSGLGPLEIEEIRSYGISNNTHNTNNTHNNSRRGRDYYNTLRLLFLAQRFEESVYQRSAGLADYLKFICTKRETYERACLKRHAYLTHIQHSHSHHAQHHAPPTVEREENLRVEFMREVLFVWFLQQDEPAPGSGGYRY